MFSTVWGSTSLQKDTASTFTFGQRELCGMERFLTHSLPLGAAEREVWTTQPLISLLKSEMVAPSKDLKFQTRLCLQHSRHWLTFIQTYGPAIIRNCRLTVANDCLHILVPQNKTIRTNSPLVHSEDFYVHMVVHGCDSTSDQMS